MFPKSSGPGWFYVDNGEPVPGRPVGINDAISITQQNGGRVVIREGAPLTARIVWHLNKWLGWIE